MHSRFINLYSRFLKHINSIYSSYITSCRFCMLRFSIKLFSITRISITLFWFSFLFEQDLTNPTILSVQSIKKHRGSSLAETKCNRTFRPVCMETAVIHLPANSHSFLSACHVLTNCFFPVFRRDQLLSAAEQLHPGAPSDPVRMILTGFRSSNVRGQKPVQTEQWGSAGKRSGRRTSVATGG